ncbi:MAG: hypothetical protein WCK75_11850 [Elusimicrobiota bacterium]
MKFGKNMANKTTVIGNISSGKSTFSKKLAEKLGIEVFYLDLLLVKKDFTAISEDEFLTAQRKMIEKPKWIIEGVAYWSSVVERFKEAEEIILMDLPVETCIRRYHERMVAQQKEKNQFISEGCDYSKMIKQAEIGIEWFDRELKPKVIKLMNESRHAARTILRNEIEIEEYLNRKRPQIGF